MAYRLNGLLLEHARVKYRIVNLFSFNFNKNLDLIVYDEKGKQVKWNYWIKKDGYLDSGVNGVYRNKKQKIIQRLLT